MTIKLSLGTYIFNSLSNKSVPLTYILDIVLIIIFAIGQLIIVDFRLSSIMIFLSFFIIISSIIYCKKSKAVIKKEIEMQRKLYSEMNDNFNNAKFIKLNNLQEKEEKEFAKVLAKSNEFHKEKARMDTNYNIGVENIVKLGPHCIFILSAYLYMLGSISIGSIYVTLDELIERKGKYYQLYSRKEEITN